MNVFLSPHNDDETLFGAFTILRERPAVYVVFRGDPRSGDPDKRVLETSLATRILGARRFVQGAIQQEPADVNSRTFSHDKVMQIQAMFREIDEKERPDLVWAPAMKPCGNAEHVVVGHQASVVFGPRVVHYHTYYAGQKVVQQDKPVPYEPPWIRLKHIALACYETQFEKAGRHFVEDLREWYA